MKRLAVFACVVLLSLASASPVLAEPPPRRTFVVVLRAAAEVPLCAVADRSDLGLAIFHVRDEDQGTVRFKLIATDLPGDLTAAHIHIAPAGTPGQVVQPLALRPGVQRGLIGDGTFDNAALVDALRATPSAYYVNVHTGPEGVGCPPGVIRGQFG